MPTERILTRRARFLGLLTVLAVCGFTYFHDNILNREARLIPHLMPPAVFGVMILFVAAINPVLRRLRPRLAFSGREVAFITAMALIACSIPFYGLVNCWPTALMLPHHYERITPGWQREKVLELAPRQMLADPSVGEEDALTGYTTGLSEGDSFVSPLRVPWRAWRRTLAFWLPLVLTVTLAVVGLASVLHHQWAHNEHLPYPITGFAHSLLTDGPDGGSVLRNRLFLITTFMVLAVHMNNYLVSWWPGYLVPINLRLDFSPLRVVAPTVVKGEPSMLLFYPKIMFSVIGIAYFFATDVSFSLAVGPVLVCYVLGLLATYGFSMVQGINYLYESNNAFIFLGGYFGIFLAAAYTGRHYYLTVLGRSVGIPTRDTPPVYTVWGMRLFLVAILLFGVQLTATGLNPILAAGYAAIAVMVFTVVSRAIAETGAFYVGTWIMPAAVLLGFLGTRAVDPAAVVIMGMVGVVVMIGPGWAPMPFASQAIHLADLAGIPPGKTTRWLAIALALGIPVALLATIYWQYNDGAMVASSGWARYTARLPFDVAMVIRQRMDAQGLAQTLGTGAGINPSFLSPNPALVIAFTVTAALALLVSFLRLRFTWWPLHPILFFFLHSHQIQRLAFSFFIAWAIKAGVSKYGGAGVYRRLRPAMAGLIAGEVVAAVVPILVGIAYKLSTGDLAPRFSVFLL